MSTTPLQLLGSTPEKVRKRANKGRAVVMTLKDILGKPTSKGKCRSIHLRIKLDNDESSHMYHSAQIRVYGSRSNPKQYLLRNDSIIWVHCWCPYFLYYCEQALTAIKASDIYDCDPGLRSKDRSVQRNPNLVAYACKHLYAAIEALMKAEQNKTKYTPFINKRSTYDGDYDNKIPPSLSDRLPARS